MRFLEIKYYDVEIVKEGKVSKHSSTAKGKTYSRGKIYLPDALLIGEKYQLMELDEIDYEDILGKHIKGRGYIIFIKGSRWK